MSAQIIDRGRGPEIAGTRTTVYHILDYVDHWHPTRIASFLRLSTDQVAAAIRYIDEHREEVMAEYQEMLERDARGNSPEIEAMAEASHARMMARLQELQQAKLQTERDNGASDSGGS